MVLDGESKKIEVGMRQEKKKLAGKECRGKSNWQGRKEIMEERDERRV
jgi:hypothetical protein